MNRAVRVTVPATSANLGPGFDALGLALDLHDVVEAHTVPAESGGSVRVAVEGVGAGALPQDESHLVVRAIHAIYHWMYREEPPGLDLRCINAIPHGRGLGSSAAAIVAGVLAARALIEGGLDLVDDETVLAMCAGLEGHPDNVAPCLLGGLTLAWNPGERARAIRLEIHPDIRPILCVPDHAVLTDAARGLLPDVVPHTDASRNAARVALLVAALRGRPDLLLDATEDLLHQSYRAAAMPETSALVASLRARGLPAVVSGAGPSVLVLAGPADSPDAVREAIDASGWDVRGLAVDNAGAVVDIL
ncbi:MAG TPA: homoserine kinase [Jiangellaceae bacterium]|nr:homoserine kinase [Jiangellaceae bacterium]